MYLPYFDQDLGSKKKVAGILAHVWLGVKKNAKITLFGKKSFLRITFELSTLEAKFKHHGVPLIKVRLNMYLLT